MAITFSHSDLLMELTCLNSIKSGPILLTPFCGPLKANEAVQFHRHTFQYLLLPIDTEQVDCRELMAAG